MSTASETVKNIGHRIAEGATQAADWVKEKTGIGEGKDKGTGGIREHMSVMGSDGMTVGTVDRVDGGAIKLTRDSSQGGTHHFIPMGWVERVDNHVHLNKTGTEAQLGWKSDAAACGCGG